jgi:hypothetical protein
LGDRHGYGQLTRFVNDEVRALLEVVTTAAEESDERSGINAPTRVTVDDYLATLWS